jgi:hypothetical protein
MTQAQLTEPLVSITLKLIKYKICSHHDIAEILLKLVLNSSYKEEDIWKLTNQKQEWPVAAMFIDGSELNEQSL